MGQSDERVFAAVEMAAEWRPLWDRTVAQYNAALEKLGEAPVLGYLFSRIGNDAGKIMKGI